MSNSELDSDLLRGTRKSTPAATHCEGCEG
jgi:hypothetical protein